MRKGCLLGALALMLVIMQMFALAGCAGGREESGTDAQSAADAQTCVNSRAYTAVLGGIPAEVGAQLGDILVKGFNLRYSAVGLLEGGTIRVWRYNGTSASVDSWTEGVITLSGEGSVSFAVEYEEITLLSEYSPRNRSQLPIDEILSQIEATDIRIAAGDYVDAACGYYTLTLRSEEQVAYVAAAGTGVDYYDGFTLAAKPAWLSEECYEAEDSYYFILTSHADENAAPEGWTVFMFEK